MTPIAIIEVDNLLVLVDAARTTGDELIIMEKAGLDPVDEQGYYDAANYLLGWRSAYNANAYHQALKLCEIARMDSITLEPPVKRTPEVNVPIFALGL